MVILRITGSSTINSKSISLRELPGLRSRFSLVILTSSGSDSLKKYLKLMLSWSARQQAQMEIKIADDHVRMKEV